MDTKKIEIVVAVLLSVCLLNPPDAVYGQTSKKIKDFHVFDMTKLNPDNKAKAGKATGETIYNEGDDSLVVSPDFQPDLSSGGTTSGSAITSTTAKGMPAVSEVYVDPDPVTVQAQSKDHTGLSQEFLNSKRKLFTYAATAGYADPMFLQAAMQSQMVALSMAETILQSGDVQLNQLKNSDATGRIGEWAIQHCRALAAKNAASSGITDTLPSILECMNNMNLLKLTSSSGSKIDDNTKLCGFSASSLPSGAQCGNVSPLGSGTVISKIKLSYLLFPDSSSSGASEQSTFRKEFEDTFNYKCYVCQKGGTTTLGQQVADNVVHRWIQEVVPTESINKKYDKVLEVVYTTFLAILHAKCTEENKVKSGTTSTATVNDIFHMTYSNGKYTPKKTWDDGNFWASSSANTGTGGTIGVSPIEALDYLSFNGFRLTPAIVDGFAKIVTLKSPITAYTDSTTGSNTQCDDRLGTSKWGYTQVKSILAATSTGGGGSTADELPDEINAVLRFSQRLALGKTYDACNQVLAKISQVKLLPELLNDATDSVTKVCGGNVDDPTAFGRNQLSNAEEIREVVASVFESIAGQSGRLGATMAKTSGGGKDRAS